MNALVVYKSKTGFTKRYAEWIASELSCDLTALQDIKRNNKSYELIIFGGPIHAGMIGSLKKAKELFNRENQKLIVFATGATPAALKEQTEQIWQTNFTKEERLAIPHFYFQSGLCYEKMGFGSRMLMKAFSSMMDKKKDKADVENGIQNALKKSHDYSAKDNISPLIACAKKYVH